MPITIENVFDLGGEEEAGRLVSLRRGVRLSGLTSTNPENYAAEVFASSVVPASGSVIAINGSTLYLRKRSLQVSDDVALGQAVVELGYERSEGSSTETGTVPTLGGRGSLRRVDRTVDRDGNPYEVIYTYPEDSNETYPNGQAKALTTEKVGATLSVLEPSIVLSGSVTKETHTPGAIIADYDGKVNSIAWQGYDPRHWLCIDANFTLIDDTTTPPLWRFDFAFELDDTGWDTQTTVIFINPQTGQAPPDIAEGNGLLTVSHYETKNFNEDF